MLQAGVGSARGNVSLTGGSVETKGGAFTATAPGSVSLERFTINSSNNSEIPASPITLTANSVSINTPGNNPGIHSNTSGNGDGALISINANSLALQPAYEYQTATRVAMATVAQSLSKLTRSHLATGNAITCSNSKQAILAVRGMAVQSP